MRTPRFGLVPVSALLACLACATPQANHTSATAITIDTLITAEDATWSSFGSAAFLGDSTLVLSESQSAQLLVVSLTGGEPRIIGRRGGGPGELQLPAALHVRGDTITVIDVLQARRSRFLADGTFIDNVSVSPKLAFRASSLESPDTALTVADGADSVIAERLTLDGTSLGRYGKALAAPASGFPLKSMKQEALSGRIPEQLKNAASATQGSANDLWLVTHFTGQIQHWSIDGSLIGTYQMSPGDLTESRKAFFEDLELQNLNSMKMPSPRVVGSLLPDSTGAWVLFRHPEGSPATLIRLDATAREIRRVELPNVESLGVLLRSPSGTRVIGVVPGEGVVLEISGLEPDGGN